jgi:hypothetical protein
MNRQLIFASLLAMLPLSAIDAQSGPRSQPGAVNLDLAKPFGARSPWRFVASQQAEMADPIGTGEEKVPGAIRLCITKGSPRNCAPDLGELLALPSGADLFAEPHYLNDARVVSPADNTKLLLLQVASLHAGNNDQRTATALFAYDRPRDAFVQVYGKQTGRNNNQEVRYIPSGALRGAVVSAEPTNDAPYGFWIVVSRLAAGTYKQVLRYRSATRYGDGNSLAVIDSEMPAIQRRLGLWRPGMPLPVPQGRCPKPHLVNDALWC